MRRETFEILGAPAHLEHPRGTLDAPHAVYRRDAGIVQADGGVAAVLIEGGRALAPGFAGGAASDEPLRVEATRGDLAGGAVERALPRRRARLAGRQHAVRRPAPRRARSRLDGGERRCAHAVAAAASEAGRSGATPTVGKDVGSERRRGRRRRRATHRSARDHRGRDELQRGRGVCWSTPAR